MALQVAVLVLLEASGRPPAGSRHQALVQLSQDRVSGMSTSDITKHAVSHAAMPMHISAITTVTMQLRHFRAWLMSCMQMLLTMRPACKTSASHMDTNLPFLGREGTEGSERRL